MLFDAEWRFLVAMPPSFTPVLTIGHYTRRTDEFIDLILGSGVTAIADVRSFPVSKAAPHFDGNALQSTLREIGLAYVFLGKELGGRPRSEGLYTDGIADYEKMASTVEYQRVCIV